MVGGGGHDARCIAALGREAFAAYFTVSGASSDIFVLEGGADGHFKLAEGALAANAFAYVSGGAKIMATTRLYVVDQSASGGSLYCDPDGSGSQKAALLAQISCVDTFALAAGNFLVI